MKDANGGNRWIVTVQWILAMMYLLKTATASKTNKHFKFYEYW